MEGNMKIIGLKVDGIRKLTAAEMEFKDKGLTPIYGKNKQGKTTLIDTIEFLISGNKVLNKDIIQKGKEKATAFLKVGDYEIKRIITEKTQKLEVKNTATNTAEKGEIQNFLNTFVNELTFNPRPFLDKTPLQQLKFVMDLFKIDFTEIENRLTSLEQDRTICGRELKKFGDLEAPEKADPINIAALSTKKKLTVDKNNECRLLYDEKNREELRAIDSFNKEQRDKARLLEIESDRRENLTKEKNYTISKIEELKAQLKKEIKSLEEIQQNLDNCKKQLDLLPEPEIEKPLTTTIPIPEYESVEEIEEEIEGALANNLKVAAYNSYLEKVEEKKAKENEYREFADKIKALRNQKLEALRKTKTGVEGLEIREDGLFYNDIFSENWSDAESIRISSELCLAQMPKLRAIFIDRFESFDKESQESFGKWAEEHDIQAIVTIVEDDVRDIPDGTFFIEEGKLKLIHKEEVEA